MHSKNLPANDGLTARQCEPPEHQPLQTPEMKALAQVREAWHPRSTICSPSSPAARACSGTTRIPIRARESLNEIFTAGEKAVSLIRQLLLFSGRQKLHAQILDLHRLIEETGSALRRLSGAAIAVGFRLAPGLPFVPADAGMMEQILLGLGLNARDAMPGTRASGRGQR